MNEQVVIPTWALSVVFALFTMLIAVARWGAKSMADRIETDIKGLQKDFKEATGSFQTQINELRDRVTRVETIIGPGGGGGFGESPTNPRGRVRHFTPPPIGGGG